MSPHLFKNFFEPRSGFEDGKRREFILNVLLVSSIVLFFVAVVVYAVAIIYRPLEHQTDSMPVVWLAGQLAFLCGLYYLSRRGYFIISAYIVIFLFYILAVYMGYVWGIDVNASLLLYSLIIVMAGILVSTRFAFIMTFVIALTMLTLGHLQFTGVLEVNSHWRAQLWTTSDTVMTIIIFLTVAIVSWLSNREIEKSLKRAWKSEADLKRERDSLEIAVEKRAQEIKELELEKIASLYRFAEFGRLSSGLFHDLLSPLTAVALNLEKAKEEKQSQGELDAASSYLSKAVSAATKMQTFIGSVRKQMQKEEQRSQFFLADEIKEVIEILTYKARKNEVLLEFSASTKGIIVGDPVKLSQVVLNLITNAIDAYDAIHDSRNRVITITLKEHESDYVLVVSDFGEGFSENIAEKIFEPFFTTKLGQTTKGTGIGLSMVKRIIEKDFKGTITAHSSQKEGTTFSLTLPKQAI